MSMEINVLIGGPAGEGIMSLGKLIAKSYQKYGWYVFVYDEHPSLIRGGHNISMVRASTEKIYSQRKELDVIVALDKSTIEYHKEQLKEKGIILVDETIAKGMDKVMPLKLSAIATELGSMRYYNTVAFGAVSKLLGLDKKVVEEVIKKLFGKKGKEVVDKNLLALRKGREQIKKSIYKVKKLKNKQMLIDGNSAVALGAIRAGLKYLGQYPMTPASSILNFIAKYEKDKKIVVKQTEDELAAINSVIGAAFTGARAMTATSGGGFSLMTEALGMAGMAEVPIVIVESQRGSPSTGMPTHTEQGDLRFIMHASQGEFPRVVITPGDVEEAYYLTFEAFNIAELIQSPVIILIDKYLSSTIHTTPIFKDNMKINRHKLLTAKDCEKIKEYKRYSLEKDGISYRALPSYPNCMHVASSYEHDETGFTTEEIDERIEQMNKRMRKLASILKEVYEANIYEEKGAEINLICWGSTKMPCLEAQKMLKEEGIKVNVVHYKFIVPFPFETTIKYLTKPNVRNIIIEQNYLSQFKGVIREYTGIHIEESITKYDGREIFPEEIVSYIKGD